MLNIRKKSRKASLVKSRIKRLNLSAMVVSIFSPESPKTSIQSIIADNGLVPYLVQLLTSIVSTKQSRL